MALRPRGRASRTWDESRRATSMEGRVCLVTGATSGIGLETVRGLARMGATVLAAGRNPAKVHALVHELRITGCDAHGFVANLASLDRVRSLAREVLAKFDRLDVLVNNAALANIRRKVTADGMEETFQVNHIAYFLLTSLLLDRLRASAPSRIVNVSSVVHARGRIDFEDLQLAHGYSVVRAYANSKLANVLFTYELARRLEGSGVSATTVHPGGVRTGIWRDADKGWRRPFMALFMLTLIPSTRGASPVVRLASDPLLEGVTGKYFDRHREARSSQTSNDPQLAARLWEVSARLAGVDRADG